MRVRDIMTSKVLAVGPGHSVRHAAQIMLDHGVGGLPVIDDEQHLVGILTAGDLLRRSEFGMEIVRAAETGSASAEQRARAFVKSHSWKVEHVMTSEVDTVDEDTPVGRIAALMDQHRVKRLPVMRGNKLVGIVSRTDLLRAFMAAGPDATAPGDDAIRRSIVARLGENTGLEEADVSVTVNHGMVYLSGTVGSESEREAARVVAEGVRGVAGVTDHLTVIAEAGAPAATPQRSGKHSAG